MLLLNNIQGVFKTLREKNQVWEKFKVKYNISPPTKSDSRVSDIYLHVSYWPVGGSAGASLLAISTVYKFQSRLSYIAQ